MVSNVPAFAARMLNIRSLQKGRCWLHLIQRSMRETTPWTLNKLGVAKARDTWALYSCDGRLNFYTLRCSAVLRMVLLLVALPSPLNSARTSGWRGCCTPTRGLFLRTLWSAIVTAFNVPSSPERGLMGRMRPLSNRRSGKRACKLLHGLSAHPTCNSDAAAAMQQNRKLSIKSHLVLSAELQPF